MKKTIIAVALLGLAGTASANDIKIQADIYSGRTHVSTYTVIVGDGQTIEVQDKQLQTYRDSTPAQMAQTVTVTDDPLAVVRDADMGISIKMTPRRLNDGQILVDAAVSSRTLIEMRQEVVNGTLKETPITREHSYNTQMIVASSMSDKTKLDSFYPESGTWVSFSATEI